jgi:hypothetical protein
LSCSEKAGPMLRLMLSLHQFLFGHRMAFSARKHLPISLMRRPGRKGAIQRPGRRLPSVEPIHWGQLDPIRLGRECLMRFKFSENCCGWLSPLVAGNGIRRAFACHPDTTERPRNASLAPQSAAGLQDADGRVDQ